MACSHDDIPKMVRSDKMADCKMAYGNWQHDKMAKRKGEKQEKQERKG